MATSPTQPLSTVDTHEVQIGSKGTGGVLCFKCYHRTGVRQVVGSQLWQSCGAKSCIIGDQIWSPPRRKKNYGVGAQLTKCMSFPINQLFAMVMHAE